MTVLSLIAIQTQTQTQTEPKAYRMHENLFVLWHSGRNKTFLFFVMFPECEDLSCQCTIHYLRHSSVIIVDFGFCWSGALCSLSWKNTLYEEQKRKVCLVRSTDVLWWYLTWCDELKTFQKCCHYASASARENCR